MRVATIGAGSSGDGAEGGSCTQLEPFDRRPLVTASIANDKIDTDIPRYAS